MVFRQLNVLSIISFTFLACKTWLKNHSLVNSLQLSFHFECPTSYSDKWELPLLQVPKDSKVERVANTCVSHPHMKEIPKQISWDETLALWNNRFRIVEWDVTQMTLCVGFGKWMGETEGKWYRLISWIAVRQRWMLFYQICLKPLPSVLAPKGHMVSQIDMIPWLRAQPQHWPRTDDGGAI